MRLGIDASNVRVGGGITHLVELLRAAEPSAYGFSEVIVWSGRSTLGALEDRSWLVKIHQPLLDRSVAHRAFWQRFRLSAVARGVGCDLLFVPGGSYAGDFHPVVTMSRNLLPFEPRERRRYGCSFTGLRLMLLRLTQARTFERAEGLIFLSQYARDTVMAALKGTSARTAVIPHGVDQRFACAPREQRAIDQYSPSRPFRIVYVSIVDLYKHQWNVAEAVAQLRHSGFPVVLELIGPSYVPALRRLEKTIRRIDPRRKFIHYTGPVPYAKLHASYSAADVCLFASSCENMPNIVLEGMASGLPIACSNRGPMPEVVGDGGVYFDPESSEDIAHALRQLIESPNARVRSAQAAFERSKSYSWQCCAAETFQFLRNTAEAPVAYSAAVDAH